ncbi:MAG TPA: glucose-6-phosphate dehydrogenase assembly protein OpcA, partial [Candidatus Limnocylindrales bacterium]
HCVLPAPGMAETCAEMIYVTAGGETGRHLGAIVVPLLIHDLPVMLWWPAEPEWRSEQARALLRVTDRLVVDGSGWPGDGLERLVGMARVAREEHLVVADFGLVRQARWREAIASVFDLPEFQPFLRAVDRIVIDYAAADDVDADASTNIVKPVYHAAWLGSRLDMTVVEPLHPVPEGGRCATLGRARGTVEVRLRPVASSMPGGTTLRVEIQAERRGRRLLGEVTAEQETVDVRLRENGDVRLERSFLAPRQREVDLLSQVIEDFGRDPVAAETLEMAAALAAPDGAGQGRHSHRRPPR